MRISRLPVEGYPALTIAPPPPAEWDTRRRKVLYRSTTAHYACENRREGGALTLSADRPVSV